jgi:hypothetical protein
MCCLGNSHEAIFDGDGPRGQTARQLGLDQKKDKKEIKALSQRVDQLQQKLGPEFVVLENILADIDLKSPDGREIALIVQSLNQSCPE